jgi:hypothetical protein
MQRAWSGFVLCAALSAQAAKVADNEALLGKLKEARERTNLGGSINLNGLTTGRSGDVLLDANPATARLQGMTLLMRPPDQKQVLASFAERLALLGNDGGGDPRMRGLVVARARPLPWTEHLAGLETLKDLRDALVTSDEPRKATLVLLCAALFPGDPTTVASVLRCLDSKDAELRWRAALGLSWSAGSAAVREAEPALIERLNDTDPTVRAFAAGALIKVAPQAKELPAALAALEKDPDPTARQLAAQIRAMRWPRTEVRPQPQAGRRGAAVQPAPVQAPQPASQPTTRRRREIG